MLLSLFCGRRASGANGGAVCDRRNVVSDRIFGVAAFEKFLHDRVKVEGRTGNLGDTVTVTYPSNMVGTPLTGVQYAL